MDNNNNNNNNSNGSQLPVRAVDLLAPTSRFATVTRLYGRLHRCQVVLSRYWWLPVLVTLCVMVPVYLRSAASAPAYESKSRMWLAGKLNLLEGRLYTEELVNFLGTQSELLSSGVVLQRALTRLGRESPQLLAAAREAGNRRGVQARRQAEVLLGKWLASAQPVASTTVSNFPFVVKVSESSKSSVLELSATGAEPASTRAFLDCLMTEYLDFKREAREKTSDRAVASVSEQVAQLAKELKVQQERLYAFQSSNNVVFLQEQGNSAGSYLALLSKQLATLRTEFQFLQLLQPEQFMEIDGKSRSLESSEAVPAALSNNTGVPASLAGPQTEIFRSSRQIQLLKAKRDELARFLRPGHPKIIKLNEDIATQERVAQIAREEALKQLGHRRQALQLEIQNLESAFKEWDGKAIEASRKIADYDRIRQDLQRLQAAYDKLLGMIQTVDIGKTLDQENVAVLEPASVARPTHGLLKNMLLAAAGSLLLGFGLLYIIGLFDDRFASLSELVEQLDEEVIGQIPQVALKKPKGTLRLETLEKQRFEFLESFRNVRASLMLLSNGRTRPKTILISSSVPREGKSTVAAYLAATLALGNSRVLLVDADMRRGTLHKHFGLAASPGLAEILNGEIASEGSILPTTLERLGLLPAGVARRNPGELVLSSEWSWLLNEVYPRFDFILIDSPPILATHDAAVLASKVDGVLFVVRASYTSARMAREALDALRKRQVHVLGLIFNRIVSSRYEYHCYQHYRNDYCWQPAPTPCVGELAHHNVEAPGNRSSNS